MVLPPLSPLSPPAIAVEPEQSALLPVEQPLPVPTPADVLFDVFSALISSYLVALESHWNVTGREFFELHRFFRHEYERLFDELDHVAELRRGLGERIDLRFEPDPSDEESQPIAPDGETTAMIAELERLESVISSGRFVLDPTLAAVVDEISEGNRKSLWKLRSFLGTLPGSAV